MATWITFCSGSYVLLRVTASYLGKEDKKSVVQKVIWSMEVDDLLLTRFGVCCTQTQWCALSWDQGWISEAAKQSLLTLALATDRKSKLQPQV